MIARWRLYEGNKRDRKRWRGLHREDSFVAIPLRGWQRLRKTTKVCSCEMCGNPRRHWGQRTIQELRAVGVEDGGGDTD